MSVSTEVGRFGKLRVLHAPGAPVATVSGEHHAETLDLAGWRSRRAFYVRLAAGRHGRFYMHRVAACDAAIAVLEVL